MTAQHPANFVVDTGGEVISISRATATAIGRQEPERKISLKVFGSSGWDKDAFLLPGVDLSFNTIRYTNFPVVVLNLTTPSALLGFQLGGIVGHKFLSKYRVGDRPRAQRAEAEGRQLSTGDRPVAPFETLARRACALLGNARSSSVSRTSGGTGSRSPALRRSPQTSETHGWSASARRSASPPNRHRPALPAKS